MHKSFWTVFIALSSVLLCLFWPIGSAPGSHSVRAQNTRTLQQPWQCTDSDIEKFCITARLGHTTEHLMATFLFYIHIYMQKYKEPEINQSRPGWVFFFFLCLFLFLCFLCFQGFSSSTHRDFHFVILLQCTVARSLVSSLKTGFHNAPRRQWMCSIDLQLDAFLI